MPFGARTIPSSRSVLTCKPNLPGGRFGAPLPAWCPSSDSNGSRRACFTSLSAAAGAVPGVLGFSTVLTARFAGGFFAPAFAAGLVACAAGLLADGIPGLAAVCGAGLVAAGAAGFAAACGVGLVGAGAAGLAAVCGAGFVAPGAAGLPAPACAGFALLGAVGFARARNPGAAATIRIPSPRVIAERIVRSFQFTITGPPQLQAWFRLQEPHPCRRVW